MTYTVDPNSNAVVQPSIHALRSRDNFVYKCIDSASEGDLTILFVAVGDFLSIPRHYRSGR